MDNMRLASILRDLLESRGIQQKWLAGEAGTTEATISRYVYGVHQPSLYIMIKIAEALNVPMDYLCGLTGSATAKETLTEGAELLLNCFARADSRDRRAVWVILERYLTESEQARGATPIAGEGEPLPGFGHTGTRGA